MKAIPKYERQVYKRGLMAPIILILLVLVLAWVFSIGFFWITKDTFALIVPGGVITPVIIVLGIWVTWEVISTNKQREQEEDEKEKAFKPYRVTVKAKQCCGGYSEIYTEEFPELIFHVSRVDYFKMQVGKKYTIYSSIIDNYPSQTQLWEETNVHTE